MIAFILNKTVLFSFFIGLCTTALTLAQTPTAAPDLVSALNSFSTKYPTEKVYLHTDKPYYALGDTIWFKAYTVIGSSNRPSQLSGALYVDLIDQADSIVQALKLPLINGLAKGHIALSDEWNAGHYRIRAYTQWMRNAGADFFYQQFFPLGNPVREKMVATASLLPPAHGTDNKEVVRLHFADGESKQPMADQKVKYNLVTKDRFYTGEGVTSEEGDLFIDVTGKGKENNVYQIRSALALEGKNFKQNFTVPFRRDSVEVAFFPEGGTLVSDLQQRIAVKVTDEQGIGLNVRGEIRNSKNESIAVWYTQHAGMSLFNLVPRVDESYHAIVHFANGSEASYPLPQARPVGHALSVYTNTDTDSILIRIQSSADNDGTVHLLAQQHGIVAFSETIDQRTPLLQLYVPKRVFPTGITQFTLFNQAGQPLAERIAFLQQADSILIDSPPLLPTQVRDSVRIPLHLQGSTDAVFTSLSVSVIDETRIPVNEALEHTIFSQLLLQSDLRGYIEKPAYYFTAINDRKRDHLDLLMMTQGYRHFVWKALSQEPLPEPQYAAEPLLQEIKGALLTLKGKPVKDGKITLLSNRLGISLDTLTDENGRFRFDKLLIQDSLAFTLQGRTHKGGDKVEIVLAETSRHPVSSLNLLLSPQVPDPNMQQYLNSKRDDAATLGSLPGKHMLDEVEVTARRNQYFNIRGLNIPIQQLDHVIHPKASDSCRNLLECIQRWVPGIAFGFINRMTSANRPNIRPITSPTDLLSYSGIAPFSPPPADSFDDPTRFPELISNGSSMQLLYNGFPIAPADQNYEYLLKNKKAFDPENIKAIYIKEFTGTGATFTGMDNINTMSFLFIETKDGFIFPPDSRWDYALLKPQGYSIVREFYSPRYQGRPEEATRADWRSTVYWNPDVRVNKRGDARIDYFNANRPGTYRVVIEGINSEGQLGRKILRYEVRER